MARALAGVTAAAAHGKKGSEPQKAYPAGRPLQGLVLPMLFLNDVGSRAFDKSKDFTPLLFGNLKSIQSRMQMAEEFLPIPETNSHPLVRSRHIPAGVIQGASSTRAKKID